MLQAKYNNAMKYKSLIYNGQKYTNQSNIDKILSNNNLHWLIDAEIEDAEIEVKNNTLIWYDGTWYFGYWYFGIWKDGIWKDGTFENGIFEKGTFEGGTFKSGIDVNNNIVNRKA